MLIKFYKPARNLILLLVISQAFSTCDPENIPPSCYKLQLFSIPFDPLPHITCLNPGDNCNMWPCPPNSSLPLVDSFLYAYDHSDVAGFFATKDWYSVFPGLSAHTDIVDSLINGNYSIYVDPAGSVVIRKTPGLGESLSENLESTAIFGFYLSEPCSFSN